MKIRTFVLAGLALGVFAVGCQSKDAQVAEALTREVLAPVEAAKEGGDKVALAKQCLAMSMVLEAPEVAEQAKQAESATRTVVDKLKKLCEGAPSLGEMVNEELEKELKKGEKAAPDSE